MDSNALDALVAAPRNHRLAFENEVVRVLETVVHPGEIVPLHEHRWNAAYFVLEWSDFVRRDADGVELLDTRRAGISYSSGDAMWGPAMGPHTLENVGSTPLRVISVELKVVS